MNDTLSPLVSIIICVYNGEKYLERCLQSAMSQSYKNIEIIVVNDGSMDNTPVIIENYVKLDCRIIVINKQNEGISEQESLFIRHSLTESAAKQLFGYEQAANADREYPLDFVL